MILVGLQILSVILHTLLECLNFGKYWGGYIRGFCTKNVQNLGHPPDILKLRPSVAFLRKEAVHAPWALSGHMRVTDKLENCDIVYNIKSCVSLFASIFTHINLVLR